MIIKQKFLDHIILIRVGVKDGKFYMPVQSEVEYIAIETLGSRGNIYFDSIPLTDSLYLKWDGKLRGWEIRHKSIEDTKIELEENHG